MLKIVILKNKVLQSKATIDVYLNQRFDLIPNLVECVKTYMEYERDILEKIIKERAEYIQKVDKDLEKAGIIDSKCNYIVAVAENYPELKTSEHFINLSEELSKMENKIQAARRLYNGDATIYNTKIKIFPSNIVATVFNHKLQKLFEIPEFKKQNIKFDI